MKQMLAVSLALGAAPAPAQQEELSIVGHYYACTASVAVGDQQLRGELGVGEDGAYRDFKAELGEMPVDSNPKVYAEEKSTERWSHIGKAWWKLSWWQMAYDGQGPMAFPAWPDAKLVFRLRSEQAMPEYTLLHLERGTQFDLSSVVDGWSNEKQTAYFSFPLSSLMAHGAGLDRMSWQVQRPPFRKVPSLKRRYGFGQFDLVRVRATAAPYEELLEALRQKARDAERQCERKPIYEDNSIVI
ncbi:hypothetical protein L7H23_06630 [Sphingopyxis sp. BSN-002]|uniref:hypothetical protein n=1 Tax=Sphingopyxis sp. BSN-002 TaxID=2911495 RepID=UPI001EDADBF6|nr:hypothetical protein [Sphingopyxis sp. BSN-002]UKK85776.1 hypothetical protein L7H23_06630 [Sphingopyxis sp. BSN-002]